MLGAGVVVGGVANRKGKGWVGRHAISKKKRGFVNFFLKLRNCGGALNPSLTNVMNLFAVFVGNNRT